MCVKDGGISLPYKLTCGCDCALTDSVWLSGCVACPVDMFADEVLV